jgi:FkbM family methyltransferase
MYPHFHGQHQPPADQRLRAFFPDYEYRGVFLDVGAGLPVELSGSYHFEQNGWRVLCIEPNPHLAAALRRERAEVVECALADFCVDEREFTIVHSNFGQISVSGLELFPALYEDPGVQVHRTETVSVAVRTLDWLLETTSPKIERIDILSLDTEGYELPVLRGLSRLWPTVIMLENYRGQSDGCRPYLEERGYELVLAEGLNEFYQRRCS